MKKTCTLAVCALFLSGVAAFAQNGNHQGAAYQQKAGAAATHQANRAELKKGEPQLQTNTTTTTTNVYDVSNTNKRGTTNYGVVEQTVTNRHGTTTTGEIVYNDYTPSKAALTNVHRSELSIAGGEVFSFNKDGRKERYDTNGLAGNVNMLWNMTPNFAMGLDYMMLHPRAKSSEKDGEYRRYKDEYLHAISLAGRYTLNAWDNWRVYLPMGWGMMQARMKTTSSVGENSSNNKWGTGFYAGLGVQYDITSKLFAGLEYRYTLAFISDKHLTDSSRDKYMQYHSAMFRVGMRF